MAPLRSQMRSRALALSLASLLPVSAAHAATAQLWVQAPFELSNGTLDLDTMQSANWQPVFGKALEIPYATVEPLIRQQIKAVADKTMSGTAVCDDPCPDVDWKVTSVADFAFTQTGQPSLQSVGNATENGVAFEVHAQAKVKLDVHVHAETWFDSADVDVPIEVLVGIHATGGIKLWPVVQHEGFNLSLTLDHSNIEIHGLNGEAIQLGAEIGTLIGFTPLGLGFGGPILGLVGALLGDAGAELAKKKITEAVEARLDDALKQAEQQIETTVEGVLGAATVQANAVKDKLLNTPLPGINQSFNQLSASWGIGIDVRTHVNANNLLRTVATTRFSAYPGAGKLAGKVRLPKSECTYATIKSNLVGTWTIPTGTKPLNEDLDAKLGQSCATILGAADLKREAYLGESPEKRLLSGNPANVLPSWTSTGAVTYPGTISDKGAYYECPFQVSSLPNATIVDVSAPSGSNLQDRLGSEFSFDERFLVVTSSGVSAVFDSEIKPVLGASGVVMGGEGPDSLGECKGGGGGGGGLQKPSFFDLEYKFDPEKCPSCGIRVINQRGNIIYEVTNDDAFLRTPLGSALKARVDARGLPTVGSPGGATLGGAVVGPINVGVMQP